MRTPQLRRKSRDGLTLIELLVVIMIVVMLVAAALPLAKPAFKDRKLREASRQIAGFIVGAQARAAELGRPVGVLIERDDYTTANGSARSLRLFIAETPPPYVGDAIGVKAAVGTPVSGRYPINFTTGMADSIPFLIKVGDEISFDYKLPRYRIRTVSTTQPYITIDRYNAGAPTSPLPPPPTGTPLAFQIFRRPQRSAGSPLELPTGICIDLTMSGIGVEGTDGGRQFAPDVIDTLSANPASSTSPLVCDPAASGPAGPPINYGPVVIMFAPTGSVERIYYAQRKSRGFSTEIMRPLDAIHFLVGRTEQVYDYSPPGAKSIPDLFTNTEDVKSNTMDLTTEWVSVVPTTGLVRTAENADSTGFANDWKGKIRQARLFTRSTRTMGGS